MVSTVSGRSTFRYRYNHLSKIAACSKLCQQNYYSYTCDSDHRRLLLWSTNPQRNLPVLWALNSIEYYPWRWMSMPFHSRPAKLNECWLRESMQWQVAAMRIGTALLLGSEYHYLVWSGISLVSRRSLPQQRKRLLARLVRYLHTRCTCVCMTPLLQLCYATCVRLCLYATAATNNVM